jgi:hypothetical protein
LDRVFFFRTGGILAIAAEMSSRKHLDSSGQKSKANTLDKAKIAKPKDAPISKTANVKAKPPPDCHIPSEYDNLTYITSLPEEENEDVRNKTHIPPLRCAFSKQVKPRISLINALKTQKVHLFLILLVLGSLSRYHRRKYLHS